MSEAVIFNNNYATRGAGVTLAGEGGPSTLVYNGAPLAVKSMLEYLGMLFEEVVARRCLLSLCCCQGRACIFWYGASV